MIALGIVLIVVFGFLVPITPLFWLGIILAIIGAVLFVRPVGGRRWY